MKKITYVGLERCDFVYHLANILSLQGTVLVIDNSYNLDLIDAVSTDTREIREWRNIVYAHDINIKETDISAYDYVVIYAGSAFETDDFCDNDMTLIMPDYIHSSLSRLENKMPEDISNPVYIMRDYCNKKFTLKSIAHFLNVNKKEIAGWIPFNTTDMSAYIALTHNHYSNLKNVSEEMLEALSYVVAQIFEIEGDKRKLDRVLKAATKIK